MRTARTLSLLLAAASLLLVPAWASDATETAQIALQQVQPKNALTMLRTIAEARNVKFVDEHTVEITDSAEIVQLAKSLVDLAEHPSDVAGQGTVLEAPPLTGAPASSVIACVRLQHASVSDVATALRVQLRIARQVLDTERSTVMVRDTAAQVQAALDLIRSLELPRE